VPPSVCAGHVDSEQSAQSSGQTHSCPLGAVQETDAHPKNFGGNAGGGGTSLTGATVRY